jgi:DNA-damage-inducible protein D
MDVPTPISVFESIKQTDENGEYWLARQIAVILEYTDWRNFVRSNEKGRRGMQE